VGGSIRTFGARRESETRVRDDAEESDPCKAEEQNDSCERCQCSGPGGRTLADEPNAHALSFRNSGEVGGVRSMFKQGGLNPERKLLPGSTMVVEGEATGRQSSKAKSGVHASRALFLHLRPGEYSSRLSPTMGAGAHVTSATAHLGSFGISYVQHVSRVALNRSPKTRRKRCPGTQPERGCVSVAKHNIPKTHPLCCVVLFQAQFRTAAQKLGQLQDKSESQAQVTKGDIATLLRHGNIGLARAKAESVIKDEIHADLLQTLEMYLGVVLEQFAEIEKKYFNPCLFAGYASHPSDTTRLIPSPPLVEAASGIIYAAPVLGIRGMYALGTHI
jgi:hypothetical protein